MAFVRSLLRLRKKDTVIGMMGHTQGVSSARNPPSSPARKMYSSESSGVVLSNDCNSWVIGVQRALPATAAVSVAADVLAVLSMAILSSLAVL